MIVDTGCRAPAKPDTLVTHRLITDSTGRLLVFFQTAYRSLSFSASVNGGHTWSAAQDIFPGIYGPFTTAAGAVGSIYTTVRTMHPSNICLITWDGKSWSDHIIQPAITRQAVISPPLLAKGRDSQIHLVYATRRHFSGNWQTVHSILEGGIPVNPGHAVPAINTGPPDLSKKLDFISDLLSWSGDIASDGENNLHLVCRVFSGGCYHLYYSCRTGDSGKWENFIPLTNTTRHRGHPRIIVGADKKTVHVLFSLEEEKEVRLVCISRSPSGNWDTPKTIGAGLKNDILPEIVITSAGTEAYWVNSEGVCRAHLESQDPPQNILAGEITSISAVSSADRVFLSFTGAGNSRCKILFFTKNGN